MFTATEIVAMPDNELAIYASGGYGPEKRTKLIASIRRLALADAAHRRDVEHAKGEIRGLFGRKP